MERLFVRIEYRNKVLKVNLKSMKQRGTTKKGSRELWRLSSVINHESSTPSKVVVLLLKKVEVGWLIGCYC